MNKEPTIEDHVAFKKLLEQKNPAAVEVHAKFTTTRDFAAFEAGVIQVARSGGSSDSAGKGGSPEASVGAAGTAGVAGASKNVCRQMLSSGQCRLGSKCKFSHDVGQQDRPATSATSATSKPVTEKVVKIPLKVSSPARTQKAVVEQKDSAPQKLSTTEQPIEEVGHQHSRFLGLFGVRKTESGIKSNSPQSDAASVQPRLDSKSDAPLSPSHSGPQENSSTPQRGFNVERDLEDLLMDSPPTRPNAGPGPPMSGFPSGPTGPRPFPPGFPSNSFMIPPPPGVFGMDMGLHPPPGHLPPPPHLPHPFGPGPPPPFGMMGPPPGHGPPAHGLPGSNGPGGGPHGGPPPFGAFLAPPPSLHQQQQQLPMGQYGQTYQMMYSAPPQVPTTNITPQESSFRGFSVHDMLNNSGPRSSAQPTQHSSGQPQQDKVAPGSPSADEKSRILMDMLSLGPSTTPNAKASISNSQTPAASVMHDQVQTQAQAQLQGGRFSPSLTTPSSNGGSQQQQQQKSRALLSLLKSNKGGLSLNVQGQSPSSASSVSSNTQASVAHGQAIPAPAAPATPSKTAPSGSLHAQQPPSQEFSTPQRKPRSLTATDLEEGISANAPAQATPAKKSSFFRNTRFQTGTLEIGINGNIARNLVMRPALNMHVYWRIPKEDFHTIMNKGSSVDLVIGLVRYGSYTNSPCFVAKPIERHPELLRTDSGDFYRGVVPFHAPKSAGQFVYRMFDQSSKESILTTVASSSVFTVALYDFHVNANLRHILDALSEKSKVKGISQMPTVLRGIRNSGARNNHDRADVMLNDALTITLRATEEASEVLNAWQERKTKEEAAKERGEEVTSTLTDEMRANYKQAVRVHCEAYDAVVAVMESRVLWGMVPPERRSLLALYEFLFCPHLQRSFHDAADMQTARIAEFGFDCDPRVLDTIPQEHTSSVCARIASTLQRLLPSLLPSADFEQSREAAALKLQLALIAENSIPQGTEVALFGSSHNSFGTDGADMDTTLLFPPNIHITQEDKPIIVGRLGVVLTKIGMLDVSVRATARIPIVMFKDPLAGLDCDISLQNQLAVANTRLLRAYGSIDPRVRALVFLVKYWAKRRHLNSPSDGTLSSYGFILCLIHFLQNRPVPLVPNLQMLPPNWSGSRQEIWSEQPASPSFINDAYIGPHRPSVHEQQVMWANAQAEELSRRGPIPPLPIVNVMSADNVRCNAYFYEPNPTRAGVLQAYAQQNTESVGTLLIEFFRYFCWDFDIRHSVVSIRQPKGLSKVDKAEQDGWLQSDILAIEDPFETHYDVAHVIKGAQMAYFRKELLRASTLITRMFHPAVIPDTLPASVSPEEFFTLLCEPCDVPAFTAAAKEKLAAKEAAASDLQKNPNH